MRLNAKNVHFVSFAINIKINNITLNNCFLRDSKRKNLRLIRPWSDFDYVPPDTKGVILSLSNFWGFAPKARGKAAWDLGGASLRMTRKRVAKNP